MKGCFFCNYKYDSIAYHLFRKYFIVQRTKEKIRQFEHKTKKYILNINVLSHGFHPKSEWYSPLFSKIIQLKRCLPNIMQILVQIFVHFHITAYAFTWPVSLDQLVLNVEFSPRWFPHTYGLVQQLEDQLWNRGMQFMMAINGYERKD